MCYVYWWGVGLSPDIHVTLSYCTAGKQYYITRCAKQIIIYYMCGQLIFICQIFFYISYIQVLNVMLNLVLTTCVNITLYKVHTTITLDYRFPNFCSRDPFGLKIYSHGFSHPCSRIDFSVNMDRTRNIYISECILDSYEYIPVAHVTIHCPIWPSLK